MRPRSEVLGILQPVGGGDPIPLHKNEMTVGRRPSCDIRLDYENVSGKHCLLRLLNGVWNVKDLGSTNGTTVNGARLTSEQSVMPDEELGIAGHVFTIDYDPAGPEAFLSSHKELDDEVVQERAKTSLMDLAGLDTDDTKPKTKRPKRAPTVIERLSADEA
jgi:pSer/pThr/pTyr-binding forkhead associated (FHA) protein